MLIPCSENLTWYTKPSSGPGILQAGKKAIAEATKHVKPEEIHTYQNFSRDSSLESRYGKDRIEKLRALKKKWDPKGVFTTQLL